MGLESHLQRHYADDTNHPNDTRNANNTDHTDNGQFSDSGTDLYLLNGGLCVSIVGSGGQRNVLGARLNRLNHQPESDRAA